ncbi:DUF2061 domain-containing protein [Roseibium sp.]|uniref:DUF2061 domain-containing protein n=1 Tax=Roseibium sp. TaxID=1936156 RepID=UPI003A98659D
MDSTPRTLAKSLSWQLTGIVTVTALSYPHTGSLIGALSLALSASLTGFVCFFLHEKVWNRVRWGRQG